MIEPGEKPGACRCRITAIMSAFHVEDESSILSTCTKMANLQHIASKIACRFFKIGDKIQSLIDNNKTKVSEVQNFYVKDMNGVWTAGNFVKKI